MLSELPGVYAHGPVKVRELENGGCPMDLDDGKDNGSLEQKTIEPNNHSSQASTAPDEQSLSP